MFKILAKLYLIMPVVVSLLAYAALKYKFAGRGPEQHAKPYSADWRSRTPYLGALLPLPFLGLLLYPSIIAAPVPMAFHTLPDPLLQLGFILHLPEYIRELHTTSYPSIRLAEYVPAYFFYQCLPPLAARIVMYVLKTYAFAFSLYYMITRERREGSAGLAAVFVFMLALSPWTTLNLATELRDSFALVYASLGLAFLFKSLYSGGARAWLALSGFFMAAALNCDFRSALLLALLPLYYIFSQPEPLSGWLRRLSFLLLWAGAGFAFCNASIALVSVYLGGHFWLMDDVFRTIISYSSSDIYAVKDMASRLRGINTGTVFSVAAVAALFSLAALAQAAFRGTGDRPALLAAGSALLFFLIFFLGGLRNFLWHLWFNAYILLPPAGLFLGRFFLKADRPAQSAPFLLLFALAGLLAFVPFPLQQSGNPALFCGLGLTGLGLLALLAAARRYAKKATGLMLVLLFWQLNAQAAGEVIKGDNDWATNSSLFHDTLAIHDFIRQSAAGEKIIWWSDKEEPPEYASYQQSLLGLGYTYAGNNFPLVQDDDGSPLLHAYKGSALVLVTAHPDALPLTAAGLRELNLEGRLIARRSFPAHHPNSLPIQVVIMKVT